MGGAGRGHHLATQQLTSSSGAHDAHAAAQPAGEVHDQYSAQRTHQPVGPAAAQHRTDGGYGGDDDLGFWRCVIDLKVGWRLQGLCALCLRETSSQWDVADGRMEQR